VFVKLKKKKSFFKIAAIILENCRLKIADNLIKLSFFVLLHVRDCVGSKWLMTYDRTQTADVPRMVCRDKYFVLRRKK